MDKAIKTLGIVLKRKDWKASDFLFSIYTKDFGRINLVAVGTKKINSKLNGHLSVPGIVQLVFVQGVAYKRLIQACLLEKFEWKDANDISFISCIYELLLESAKDDGFSLPWDMVALAIKQVLAGDTASKKLFILNLFIVRLMHSSGYEIKVDECVHCQSKLEPPYKFDFFERGFVCPKCSKVDYKLEPTVFELLVRLVNNRSQGVAFTVNENYELFLFLKKYLTVTFEKRFNTLEQIKKEP